MMPCVNLSYAPFVWHFVQVMGHEVPFILVLVARLKMGWFVISWSLVSIIQLEGGEAAFYESFSRSLCGETFDTY